MTDFIDVPRIYNKFKQDWNIWVEPLKNRWWYSKDYYNEVIEGFEHTTGAMRIIFITIPMLPFDHF